MKEREEKKRVIGSVKRLLVLCLLFMVSGFHTSHLGAEALEKEANNKNRQAAGILFARTGAPAASKKIYLPLKKTDVRINVVAGIVSTEVTQVFTNDTKHALEAVYVFPLPARAAVTDMVLKIGERTIKSEIHEKKKAIKIYEAAKAAGKKTALLVQKRPNIFSTSVANFLPGETVSIQLTYMETVQYNQGMYSVNFPMVVGQRYLPLSMMENTASSGDTSQVNPPLLHPNMDSGHRLSINVEITGIPVRQIKSSTHQVVIEDAGRERNIYRVSLAGPVVPDSDFNLDILLEEGGQPRFSYIHSSLSDDSYGLLTLFPPLEGNEEPAFSMPRDVVFLVDTSGSMSGASIMQAKAGLIQCLDMLRPEDRFTIVRFSTNFSSFSSQLQQASKKNLTDAVDYVQRLYADGGTEMQKALEYVLNMSKKENHMPMIVFLTDGAVGNESTLIRLLSNRLAQTRLFTFGIGSAPNEYLMRKMAEIGRGQSRFIRSTEDVGQVMADFFKTLRSPVLTDILLSWKDGSGNNVRDVEFYPNPCGDVFSGRPMQVFVKHKKGVVEKMVISGNYAGKPAQHEFLLDKEKENLRSVQRMFGRKKIDQLMYNHIRAEAGEEELIEQEIVKVSLHHQVLSRFTARVAVEEKVSRNPDGKLETVKQKVPLPKGWDPTKFHSTATNNVDFFLIGLGLLMLGFILRRLLKGFPVDGNK